MFLGDGYEWEDYGGALLPDLYFGKNRVVVTTQSAIFNRAKDIKYEWPEGVDRKDTLAVKIYIESLILTGA